MELQSKKIFNQVSLEDFMEARMVGGNPNGIINFNRTPHKFFSGLYKSMLARTWFAEQVNISKDKINYSKLTPNEKRSYDLVLAQLIANDSIQTNQLMDSFNRYITSPVVNACLSRQAWEECGVPDMEVLREDGVWVRFDTMKKGDRILAANEKLESYFTPILNVVKYDNVKTINKISGLYTSQHVTDGHRLPYIDRHNKLVIRRVSDLPKTNKINCGDIVCGIDNFKSNINSTYLPLEYRLIIAIQADGHIVRSKLVKDKETGIVTTKTRKISRRVVISVSKERKIKRLKTILNMLNIRYDKIKECSNSDSVNDTWMFRFNLPNDIKLTKVFYDAFDLSMFNSVMAKEFINELIQWDGWNYGDNTIGYDTTVKENADFVMGVALLAGYRTRCVVDIDNRKDSYKDLYRVTFSKEKLRNVRGTVKIKKELYGGSVYCPVVEGGLFFTRHQGKVSLTGNCNHAQSYAVMAEDICQDTDRIYKMHEVDEELQLKNEAVAKMYDSIYTEVINTEAITLACAANQILEAMVFQTGFAVMYSLENKMAGTAEMIKEIHKDEL